jgi:hypothetical protein
MPEKLYFRLSARRRIFLLIMKKIIKASLPAFGSLVRTAIPDLIPHGRIALASVGSFAGRDP